MSKQAAKEFWIFKGTSNFCSTLILDENCETESKAKPEGFYDVVALADTVEGGIHVREVLPNEIVLDRAVVEAAFKMLRACDNYERCCLYQDMSEVQFVYTIAALESALKGEQS